MKAISIFAKIGSLQKGQIKNKAPAMIRGFTGLIFNVLRNRDDYIHDG